MLDEYPGLGIPQRPEPSVREVRVRSDTICAQRDTRSRAKLRVVQHRLCYPVLGNYKFGDKAAMMKSDKMRFVGLDPGGDGKFGWCVVAGSGWPLSLVQSGCTGDAAAAVRSVLEVLEPSSEIHGVGIDGPLFWTPSGTRRVDCIVRQAIKEAGAPNVGGTVQHVNSLRGACLTQGVVAAYLLRQAVAGVRITEAHPKALLWLIKVASAKRRVLHITMGDLVEFITCDVAGLSEHERDAALGALTAWAMVSAAPGWRDIALEEKDVFVPVPPVEYWMPVATSPNSALHLTSGVGPANAARR